MFNKPLEVGNFAVFSYLLSGDSRGEGLVIDPADDIDDILAIAEKERIRIRYIINTHYHVDHVMGNEEMQVKTGARIIIHEADAPLLTRIPQSMLSMFGGHPSPPADRTVKDGEDIQVGDLTLKIIHTPGHTPGGMCLYADQAVFTGDTLFVGGVGRTDLPGGSGATLAQSIRDKLFTLPDETVVYPGHNYGPAPTSTIKNERLHNPFLR
ncbi:MAG: MBL fold metallo-hydrolase [Deltaproteobacteria bacterium]|nr:MBL fold metallo-hydrolase [Deltaproteobacteria bacterium]